MKTDSRFDYFLIWGHGVVFRDAILAMIRTERDITIKKIYNHTAESIENLVHAVYSHDYAPIAHLKGKTEYLKQTANEVMFVFVENHSPDEDYFGEDSFRHIESKKIKKLKEQIRDQFNPRVNGKRSEEHVIHASDNEMQTDDILRYLGFRGIELFVGSRNGLTLPYHLGTVADYTVTRIPMAKLLCRILVGDEIIFFPRVTRIEDSPHYLALTGNHQAYDDYVRKFRGITLTDDHTLRNLLTLRDSLRYLSSPHETNYIVVNETEDGEYVILDGTHRAAVLNFRGTTDVHVVLYKKIRYYDDRYIDIL